MTSLNYIDLYSGTSALSEGFKRQGLNAVAHVEADADACKTIETRVAFHHLYQNGTLEPYNDYLAGVIDRSKFLKSVPIFELESVLNERISSTSLARIFRSIEKRLERLDNRNVDLIVGGPPCQAYSVRHRYGIEDTDERLKHYLHYGKFLKKFDPKMFVFENVPGLMTAFGGNFYRRIERYFRKVGYEIDFRVLNAADYGVLQNRLRVIIIGWRISERLSYPEPHVIHHNYLVQDLLNDLEPVKAGESVQAGKYLSNGSSYLREFGIRNGSQFYTQHIARPHNSNDLNIYRSVIDAWQRDRIRLRYSELPQRLRTQKNTTSFLDRYKVVDALGLSHTIIAHIAKDGHHFIHPDANQCRSLTVREAARIQSFPDNFFFEGSRTSAFRQIGNAVPPLFAEAIAKGVVDLLK